MTILGGLSGLSLDAIASVSYGPEALVLATAGVARLVLALPVTAAITVLLIVLVFSYRQLITAFPGGGGPMPSRANTPAVTRHCWPPRP